MVIRLKTFFEQIEELIMDNPMVVRFMECGNVVEIRETDDYFSIFSYPPQKAPIYMELIGGGYTWIVTREYPSEDHWVFNVHKLEHCDYDDWDYDEDNKYDCRNCPDFHLLNGHLYYCNRCNKGMMDPLMSECYAENKSKKDVK